MSAAIARRLARPAWQARAAGSAGQLYVAQRHLASAPPLPQWEKLGFAATPTKAMIRYDWDGTKWDAGTSTPNFNVTIHGLSNVLHYGQGLFEGLKAFHCEDGKARAYYSTRRLGGCSWAGSGLTRTAPVPAAVPAGPRLQLQGQRRAHAARRRAPRNAGGACGAL